VVRSDGSGAARTGWVQAHDVVADATVVSTAFTNPAAVVALVFDDVIPGDLDTLSVSFSGCRRTEVAGRPDEPTVVVTGSQSVVVVEVTMDESVTDDPNAAAPAFTVDVRAGGAWRLAGVLAAEGSVDALADRLAGDGIDAATGRLVGTSGPGCTVEWRTPTRTRRMPVDPRRGG
jgi:hypothetical protein